MGAERLRPAADYGAFRIFRRTFQTVTSCIAAAGGNGATIVTALGVCGLVEAFNTVAAHHHEPALKFCQVCFRRSANVRDHPFLKPRTRRPIQNWYLQRLARMYTSRQETESA